MLCYGTAFPVCDLDLFACSVLANRNPSKIALNLNMFVIHSSFNAGDTSIIGAGTYANDQTCAVSATGKGEEFMRAVAAYDCSGISLSLSFLPPLSPFLPLSQYMYPMTTRLFTLHSILIFMLMMFRSRINVKEMRLFLFHYAEFMI